MNAPSVGMPVPVFVDFDAALAELEELGYDTISSSTPGYGRPWQWSAGRFLEQGEVLAEGAPYVLCDPGVEFGATITVRASASPHCPGWFLVLRGVGSSPTAALAGLLTLARQTAAPAPAPDVAGGDR